MVDHDKDAEIIFLAALEKSSPQERVALIENACAGKPELLSRLQELLASHEKSQGPFDGPPPGLGVTVGPPLLVEQPGSKIGPYKLLEQIGEGGMGLVFVAEQQQPVRRKVALKLIKPGMDSRQVIARFEAERQALAIMDHPNIAKIFDGGTTAGEPGGVSAGRPYFVMELVKGTPITAYCDQHQLPTRQRLELFVDVCQAVQHAHHKGIIHRDLKPSNVLVEVHDVRPVVKIIDFGIAKAIGQQLTDKTMYTGIAQMIGTPLYMSPEQAGLSSLDVDTRSDVYSLGVLLYELLTGSTPFDGEALKKAGYDEMRRIVREDEPPKPSARLSTLHQKALSTIAEQRGMEPGKLGPQLRGELDCVVMKALEKDRNRRYESASALAADVQRYLQDEPVLACPPSRRYRLGKFLRKHRTGVLTTAAVLAAALVLGAGIGYMALDRAARRVATEEVVENDWKESEIFWNQKQWAKALPALERASGRLVGSGLTALQAKVDARRRDVNMVGRLEKAGLQTVTDVLDSSIRDRTGVDQAFHSAFVSYGLDVAALGKEESARRVRASEIRDHLVTGLDAWSFCRDNLPGGTGQPLRDIAQLADRDAWRMRLRELRLSKDRVELERLAEEKDAQPQHNVDTLADLFDGVGAHEASLRLRRKAQQQNPTDFWLNFGLGSALLRDQATAAEAVGFIRAALVVQPQSSSVYLLLADALAKHGKQSEAEAARHKAFEVSPNHAGIYYHLGNGLLNGGKLLEAEAAYRKAIELQPDSPVVYINLGVTLSRQQKFLEEEAAYRKAIEIRPDFAVPYCNLGDNLERQKKFQEAEAASRKAIELLPDFVPAYINLGSALRAQGKLMEAVAAIRKAIELNPNDANAHRDLGNFLRDQKKLPEAVTAYRKSIELKPDNAATHFFLGLTYRDQGQFADSLASLRRGHELGYQSPNSDLPSADEVRRAEQRIVLDVKLSKVLRGETVPADATERIALAELCQLKCRQFYASATRFYSEAFAADPKRVNDPRTGDRYDAACAAVLASCGQGKDAAKLEVKEYARLRGQALDWLGAELAALRTMLEKDTDKARPLVGQKMQDWQQDTDFNGLRGEAALAKLPEAERQEWRKLWEEVEELRKRAVDGK